MCDGFELYYMEHMAAQERREREAAEKQAREAKLDAPRQSEPAREQQPDAVPV